MRLVHVRAEHYSHKHITTKPLQSSTQIVIVYAQNKMQKNAHTHKYRRKAKYSTYVMYKENLSKNVVQMP